MKRYKTDKEAIPSVWKMSKSKPKRPAGHPKKRRLSGESTVDSVKRERSEQMIQCVHSDAQNC